MIGNALRQEREAIGSAVEGRTLIDVIARNAVSFGPISAISWREQGRFRRLTWADYRHQARQIAAGLVRLGVEPEDRVAIMAANRPEHVLSDLGALHAGATPVTIYSTLSAEQLAYVAGHAEIVVAIVDSPELVGRWLSIRDQVPSLKAIVAIGETTDPKDVVPWETFLGDGRQELVDDPARIDRRAEGVSADAAATLIYTSGTTGLPKGVVITHANVLWTLETMHQAINLPDHPRFVSYLPLAHIAERMATHYLGMWTVGEVSYCANVGAVMNVVKEVRPHLFVGVPRIWEQVHRRLATKIAAEPEARKRALVERALRMTGAVDSGSRSFSSRVQAEILDRVVLRTIRSELGLDEAVMAITTAGPIDPDIIRFFRSAGIPLHELYGMTECSGPATTNLPGFDRIGTVGRPFAGVEVKLLDDGELLLRGGNVAPGYEKAPDETADSFDGDGWLHTGDLAEIDDAGYVTIVGRKKDIIVTAAGKNIAPVAIERLLKRFDIVAEACVVGDRMPHLSVLIVVDPSAAAEIADETIVDPDHPGIRTAVQLAIDDTNASVSKVERIKRFLIVTDEWSEETGLLTPSLKLKRNVILERYAEAIANL